MTIRIDRDNFSLKKEALSEKGTGMILELKKNTSEEFKTHEENWLWKTKPNLSPDMIILLNLLIWESETLSLKSTNSWNNRKFNFLIESADAKFKHLLKLIKRAKS